MKKTLYIPLFAALVFVIIAAFANADETEICKVTFRMPEGHHYVTDTLDHGEHVYKVTQELVLDVKKGHVLTAEEVEPYTHHCTKYDHVHDFCSVTTKGWDKEPIGAEITEDTVFTAVMNEDTCFVTVKMSKGKYIMFDERYDSFTIEVDKGYRITESDIKTFSVTHFPELVPDDYPYEITGFEPDPTDYEVTEDAMFTAIVMHFVRIQFEIPDLKGGWNMLYGYDMHVREDGGLKREDLPKIEYANNTVIDAYWNITDEELADLPNSTKTYERIEAFVSVKGDCNKDMIINTVDAVCVLKAAAGMEQVNDDDIPLYDADCNGAVNTSDAVYILRYMAGMIDKM